MKKITYAKLEMITAMTIFGTIPVLIRYIPYPSSVTALIRGIIGTIFLFVVHCFKKEKFSFELIKKNIVYLAASGILVGANWILLFEAYRYTTVSVATVCYYMAPVFVVLASPIFLHEKLTLKKGLCCLIALCGMIAVSGVLETGLVGLRGVILGIGAALMYATVVILNKFIRGLSAGDTTLFQLAFAAVSLVPYVLLTEDISFSGITPTLILLLAIAGIVHTGLVYTLYFGSLCRIPAQTAALFSYIDPVVAVLLSVTVLHEGMSLISLAGVILVLGATVISEIEVKPHAGVLPKNELENQKIYTDEAERKTNV